LRGAFAPTELAHYRAEFRWLQQVTGEVRDLDIHLLEFDEYRALVGADFRPGLVAVHEVLQRRRRRALLAMRRALRSERFTALRKQWPAYLRVLPGAPVIERPDAQAPIEAVAGRRIRRLYRRMVQRGNAIGETSPAEELHELRKQGKELRYMLELFGGLYPVEVVRPLIGSLKDLQDLLGRHHDRSVQVTMLRSLVDEVAARPDGVGALVAIGALSQRLLDDERAVRDAFAERFAGFTARDQRQAVKEAFR
jgi:CHAD domain-containing protein